MVSSQVASRPPIQEIIKQDGLVFQLSLKLNTFRELCFYKKKQEGKEYTSVKITSYSVKEKFIT